MLNIWLSATFQFSKGNIKMWGNIFISYNVQIKDAAAFERWFLLKLFNFPIEKFCVIAIQRHVWSCIDIAGYLKYTRLARQLRFMSHGLCDGRFDVEMINK